ncbi:hypothetical protein D3C76_982140 [compost metagenome]
MPGRLLTLPGQWGVQTDHIALLDDLLKADVIAPFSGLAWRIADQHLPAQALQDLDQSSTHLTSPHNTVSALSQVGAFDFSQGQQAAKHVVDHAPGVAARRAGPGDAGLLEVVEVQVIGADGAGTDEAHLAAFQQRTVDAGDRAHQQHIGLLDRGAVDGAPRHPADFTEMFEEGV